MVKQFNKRATNMKNTFIVLVLLFALATAELSDEQKQKLKQYNEECMKETGVPKEEVQMIRKGDFSNDDDDVQRYVLCMMMKSEVMTAEGDFQKDVAMSKLSQDTDRDKAESAMDACAAEPKADAPQTTAFRFAKCYHEHYPEADIFST